MNWLDLPNLDWYYNNVELDWYNSCSKFKHASFLKSVRQATFEIGFFLTFHQMKITIILIDLIKHYMGIFAYQEFYAKVPTYAQNEKF